MEPSEVSAEQIVEAIEHKKIAVRAYLETANEPTAALIALRGLAYHAGRTAPVDSPLTYISRLGITVEKAPDLVALLAHWYERGAANALNRPHDSNAL